MTDRTVDEMEIDMSEPAMIATRAGRFHVVERGAGRPFVLLRDHRDVDPIADRSAANFGVVAIDWSGHGLPAS
ncbi:hypothetical protein AB0L57_00930 [Nocardia sp. NPDC052254]|uniref:alpha/beta fold hydrolase n=1 Tax=Nocardia sp. NPDC052254 TaxID=3155681 RepID=UPI00343F816F